MMTFAHLAACVMALVRLQNAWSVYESSEDESTDFQEVRRATEEVKLAIGDALNSDIIRNAKDTA